MLGMYSIRYGGMVVVVPTTLLYLLGALAFFFPFSTRGYYELLLNT